MYKNRSEAGEKLALQLKEELSPENIKNALVLAIPRGGVIVGKSISSFLGLPLDCLIIKKVPAPQNEELAIGAVAEGGTVVWEEDLCQRLNIPLPYKQEIVKDKAGELEKKREELCGNRPLPEIKGKTVIIADDGVNTGATIKAGIAVARSFVPAEVIVAVPVISPDSLSEIKKTADRVVYLESPEMFFSVEQFYEDFAQPSDEEVRAILQK